MSTVLLVIYVLAAVCLIGIILLQRSKSDMGTAFGSGASGSVFGASGASDFLSRTTTTIAVIFFAMALLIARLENSKNSDSVYDTPLQTQESLIPTALEQPAAAPTAPADAGTSAAPSTAAELSVEPAAKGDHQEQNAQEPSKDVQK